jgi:hypothetical protein
MAGPAARVSKNEPVKQRLKIETASVDIIHDKLHLVTYTNGGKPSLSLRKDKHPTIQVRVDLDRHHPEAGL